MDHTLSTVNWRSADSEASLVPSPSRSSGVRGCVREARHLLRPRMICSPLCSFGTSAIDPINYHKTNINSKIKSSDLIYNRTILVHHCYLWSTRLALHRYHHAQQTPS